MIVSDFQNHKIDAVMHQDGYVRITAFQRKNDEWIVKVISLSPDAFDKLTDIVNSFRKDQQNLDQKEP